MKKYIQVNEDNRIIGISDNRSIEQEIEIQVEENEEVLKKPFIYRYENGELIKDTEYQQSLVNRPKPPTAQERIDSLEQALLLLMKEG